MSCNVIPASHFARLAPATTCPSRSQPALVPRSSPVTATSLYVRQLSFLATILTPCSLLTSLIPYSSYPSTATTTRCQNITQASAGVTRVLFSLHHALPQSLAPSVSSSSQAPQQATQGLQLLLTGSCIHNM
ncbi:hypothetical protein E2C01_000276 [Portunus trituberculatus]|uniref:Uncharacterized protein n=1 Tax=Portunus trituberculatus TaxID=210409 RepID=A0A5B7CET0_PORTR|nr:hypothetical protein [Portunus trituberculatus]